MATIGALAFIAGVLGLIKPSLLRLPNRKVAAAVLVIGFIITAAAGANSSDQQAASPQPTQQPAQKQAQQDNEGNQQAPAQSSQQQAEKEQSTPSPQQQAEPKGIGVSREAIQSVYEKPELGFKFKKGEPVDGQPQVIGEAPNGLAFVQLIGPEDNLTQASIMIGVPKDNPQAIVENGVYMLGLIKLAAPNWSDGPEWVSNNLRKAIDEGEVSTVQDGLRITLQAQKALGMAVLTVEPADS